MEGGLFQGKNRNFCDYGLLRGWKFQGGVFCCEDVSSEGDFKEHIPQSQTPPRCINVHLAHKTYCTDCKLCNDHSALCPEIEQLPARRRLNLFYLFICILYVVFLFIYLLLRTQKITVCVVEYCNCNCNCNRINKINKKRMDRYTNGQPLLNTCVL